jgi:Zn-dependent peptidase ImmA (M78 family)
LLADMNTQAKTISAKPLAAAAAAKCAVELRQRCGIREEGPISTTALSIAARRRGIVGICFNAPIASAGFLEYKHGKGYQALIAHGPGPRGRYSLAHEIGHTFLLTHSTHSQLPERFSSQSGPLEMSSGQLEEFFCETFASELLLPTRAARSELRSLSESNSAARLLSALESVSSRFSVSLRMLLIKAYSVGVWPTAWLVAVLDATWQRRKGDQEAIEIVAAYSNPQSGWYLPNEQTATDAGLRKAIVLARAWDERARRTPGPIGSAGAFQVEENGDRLRKLDAGPRDGHPVLETVSLKQRALRGGWSKRSVTLPVLYRLYASSASEAYMLAVMELQSEGGTTV